MRKLNRWALPLAAALLLGACTSADDEAPARSLDDYYGQKISFGNCEEFATTASDAGYLTAAEAECGWLEVPLDYSEPEGATGRIAVSRVPARGEKPIGSMVLNPGGPGARGVSFAALLSQAWAQSPVTENFDLVGFDPRGTGATTPAVDCFTDAERDSDALPGAILGLGTADPVTLADRCAASVGGKDVLGHIGTRDTARDMDVLRAVLGDEKLTYTGASYGTRLGPVYAEMFPDRVRAMVLDGAVDPRQPSTQAYRTQQLAGFQRAFDKLATACAEQDSCPLGTDPAQATAQFNDLVQPLAQNPVPASGGRSLGFVAAVDSMVSTLYDKAQWPQAIAGLTQLRKGKGDVLLELRDNLHGRQEDGSYVDFLEATYAISCADDEHFTPEENSAALQAYSDAAPFMAPPSPIAAAVPDDCAGWPEHDPVGHPYAVGIEGLPNTLTVSVTGDAASPHEYGISLAETLGGDLLTVHGDLHVATIAGNECVDDAVATYLVDLKGPGPGAECWL
ncbi:alpha/beta hydrolase [Kineosporia babensis]